MNRLLFVVSAVVGVGAMLALAGPVWAHAEITPSEVASGSAEGFTLEVLQEKEAPTTEIRMEVPEGFEVTGVAETGGWEGKAERGAVVWSGGEAPQEGMGIDLAFEARTAEDAGEYAFRVLQSYADGSVVEWTGAADSEEPAAFVEVASAGGTGEAQEHDHADAAQHGDEEEHGDEHGSHREAEEVPDTGGPRPAVLLAACALALAASAATLSRTLRR